MRLMTLILVLFAATAAMAKDFTAAVVDFPRLFNAYPGTISAEKKLNELIQIKQDDLSDSLKILNAYEKQITDSKVVLTPADKKTKEKELKTRKKQFQDEKSLMQTELTKRKQEMTQELVVQVRDIIADTAEKDGVDIVLDSKNVIFIKNEKDLTKEILNRFTKMKSESKN
jgi:Skp family chaperone for outer membrane proteins